MAATMDGVVTLPRMSAMRQLTRITFDPQVMVVTEGALVTIDPDRRRVRLLPILR